MFSRKLCLLFVLLWLIVFVKVSCCCNDWTAEFINGSDFNPMAYSSHASSLVVTNAHRGNYGTFDMLFNVTF